MTKRIPSDNRILAKHAAAIRRLGKRVVADVIEIGRLLTECKRICGHGNWLPWLEREFKWTEMSRLRGCCWCLACSITRLVSATGIVSPACARSMISSRASCGVLGAARQIEPADGQFQI